MNRRVSLGIWSDKLDHSVEAGAQSVECDPKRHPFPLAYRTGSDDDWGWIRDSEGHLIAAVRHRLNETSDAEHRRNGTDPYAEVAEYIVRVCNAFPAMLEALQLYVEHFGDPLKVARAAIAKATGK